MLAGVHPVLFVYVIVAEPADTALTNPVLETVATPGVPETQGLVVAGVPLPISGEVAPTQRVVIPEMVGFA